MKTLLFIVLPMFLFVACNGPKVDKEIEGKKLMQLSRDWSKSAATDDIEHTLSYWADDAIFISSGQPTLNGKEDIRGMVERSSRTPGFKISWEPISVAVSESGDMAYMIEENQITMTDSTGKSITTYGKGVTIWRKDQHGHWKNVVEVAVEEPSSEN